MKESFHHDLIALLVSFDACLRPSDVIVSVAASSVICCYGTLKPCEIAKNSAENMGGGL